MALPTFTTIGELPLANPLTGTEVVAGSQNGATVAVPISALVTQSGLAALVAAILTGLPTTLPSQAGVLWNNGGVISIS